MNSRNYLCAITGVSGVVLAIAPIASINHFPQINTSGQNPKIENTDRYTISIINLANVETKMIAQYAYRILGLRKAGLIYSDAAAGTGAAKSARSRSHRAFLFTEVKLKKFLVNHHNVSMHQV